jgi:hypothetical protein
LTPFGSRGETDLDFGPWSFFRRDVRYHTSAVTVEPANLQQEVFLIEATPSGLRSARVTVLLASLIIL